jgi:sec-independent protein translocase protein TatB
MFDVAPTELLLVAVVALVVIGPKDLPRAMRVVGQWVARARGMARHFRSGIDEMIRHSELEEMEKKWREENERIMREFPTLSDSSALPDHGSSAGEAEQAALPAPAAPGSERPAVPEPESFESRADLANWHGAGMTAEPAGLEAEAEGEAEPVVLAAPPTSPALPTVEEQLSLLPPDGSAPAPPAGTKSHP